MPSCSDEIKIIAIPTADYFGSNLFHDRDRINATAAAKGYQVINFYYDLADLMARIHAILDSPTKCLRVLEIIAHGEPWLCNMIAKEDDPAWRMVDVKTWGEQLLTLAPLGCARGWCEPECSIYLSGCNTGLSHVRRPGKSDSAATSIAHDLADAMPFSDTLFRHHITVYGSKGYLSGTNMNGDERTVASSTSGVWPFDTDYPPYPGASDAAGSNCWIPYRNW